MHVGNVDDQTVMEVARIVVREIAPQEMPLYRAHTELYFKDPAKALSTARSGDQLLGFGAGVELTLFTPVVLAVLSQVTRFLASEVLKSTGPLLQDQVKLLFSRFRTAEPQSDDPPPLTPKQLAEIRGIAYETARRLRLSDDEADLLADSTVGALAVAT